MFNIIGKRYWFFLLSLIVIVPGVISLAMFDLRLGADFTGGSETQVQIYRPNQGIALGSFASSVGTSVEFVQPYLPLGISCPPTCDYTIRTKALSLKQEADLIAKIAHAYPATKKYKAGSRLTYTTVGSSVANSTTQNAIEAVIAAAIAILLYITFAFRKMPHPMRYGAAAVIAMLHDVLVVVGIFSILGKVLNVEIDASFVTAMLTIIGFSVHDTIVIFDRIRENVSRRTGESFEGIVNHSVLQSFVRSINTSFTVVLTLGAIFLFSGESIRYFVLAMLIGIISGTYSSIFNASPILVVWETGELKRLFGRKAATSSPTGSPATRSA